MSKRRNGFVDVLGKELSYAVLTKKNRIQVVVKPTAKQLRKCVKRRWHLANAFESNEESQRHLLDEALAEALADAGALTGESEKALP